MPLINRFSRMVRADLHAVLDRLEEPEQLLRQAVRDMEEELQRGAAQAAALDKELRAARARMDELQRTRTRAEEEQEVCLDAGNHDLARTAIRRRLETERLLSAVATRKEHLSEQAAALQAQLAEQNTRYEMMRQHVECLADQDANDVSAHNPAFEHAVRDEDVEIALLNALRNRKKQ